MSDRDLTVAPTAEAYSWGEPAGLQVRTSMLQAVLFCVVALVCMALYWPELVSRQYLLKAQHNSDYQFVYVFIAFGLAWFALSTVFGNNFTVDGLKADSIGIDVAYRYTPELRLSYKNVIESVSWDEILSVEDSSLTGESEEYRLTFKLQRSLPPGVESFELKLSSHAEFLDCAASLIRIAPQKFSADFAQAVVALCRR